MKFSELLVEYLDLCTESNNDQRLWGTVSVSREKRKQECLDAMDEILGKKKDENSN